MGIATRRVRRRDSRGASAVEFALVIPIFMWVVVGIVNFGFVFADQMALSNGARQAARYAVVEGPTCLDIEAEAIDASRVLTAGAPAVTIAPGCGGGEPCEGSAPNTDVTVTLTKTSDWAIPYLPPFGGAGPTIEAEGVMRCEFS